MKVKNSQIAGLSLELQENGLLWPYYNNIRALSASKLTRFIKEINFSEIPEIILRIAAQRGKMFHEAIQEYFKTGNAPLFIKEKNLDLKKLNKTEKRVHETISFLEEKKEKHLKKSSFLANEELSYVFYNNELLATYTDISFADYIIELKSSNIKSKNDPVYLLVFEIQLLIQYLCTKKDIYLLWSTGEGIIFKKFKKEPKLFKVLNLLINLINKKEIEIENLEYKKNIIHEILEIYQPNFDDWKLIKTLD